MGQLAGVDAVGPYFDPSGLYVIVSFGHLPGCFEPATLVGRVRLLDQGLGRDVYH